MSEGLRLELCIKYVWGMYLDEFFIFFVFMVWIIYGYCVLLIDRGVVCVMCWLIECIFCFKVYYIVEVYEV